MKTYLRTKSNIKHTLIALSAAVASAFSVVAGDLTADRLDIGINHSFPAGSAYSSIAGGVSNVLIGSYSVIGGGYSNSVTEDFSFIGGGVGNTNLSEESFIGGGIYNRQNCEYGVIGGGEFNTNLGFYASIVGGAYNLIWTNGLSDAQSSIGNSDFIGGGTGNVDRGNHSSIVGGSLNQAWGDQQIIGGGAGNRTEIRADLCAILGGTANLIGSNGVAAIICGGSGNLNSSPYGFIGGGTYNALYGNQDDETGEWSTISGGFGNLLTNVSYASIGGGLGNVGTADLVTIPGGSGASATHYGQQVYASGGFANVGGTAQTSTHVLRGTTTTSTLTELFLDGAGARMTIASGSSWTYDILVVARSSGGNTAGYQLLGVIENNSGTTSLIGSGVKTVLGEDVSSWDVAVSADDTNDALVVKVAGDTSTIRWVATVRTAEVAQ
jgi:hypothetical protein